VTDLGAGRTDATSRQAAKGALDEAVFERVEGNDREAAEGTNHVRRILNRCGQTLQLAVGGNAKGLEGPRRRIDAAVTPTQGLEHDPM
jgi:hypothetical protein